MNTKQLEYLIDLQKTASLSKTAKNYYTTHQSVNHAIKALEQEFNVTILMRTPKGCSLTEAGLLVCDYAQETLHKKEALRKALSPYHEAELSNLSGKLEIYIIPRFSSKHFFKFYNTYRERFPKLSICLKTISFSVFFNLLPIATPFIFLITANQNTLSQDFFKQLKHQNLTYKILKQTTLGFVVSQKSSYQQDILTSFAQTKTPIPAVVFNYSIKESNLLSNNNLFQYFLIDNWEMQKQMLRSGEYIGICTNAEYKQYFQSREQTLLFIDNIEPVCSTSFYYIALYANSFQNEPLLQNFLTALEKHYL